MISSEILKYARHCAHIGCIGIGKWLPIIEIRLVGQTELEKPVTCAIPMFLCDKHKQECEPQALLTTAGKIKLMMQVLRHRRRRLNWDTLTIRWESESNAVKIITAPDQLQ